MLARLCGSQRWTRYDFCFKRKTSFTLDICCQSHFRSCFLQTNQCWVCQRKGFFHSLAFLSVTNTSEVVLLALAIVFSSLQNEGAAFYPLAVNMECLAESHHTARGKVPSQEISPLLQEPCRWNHASDSILKQRPAFEPCIKVSAGWLSMQWTWLAAIHWLCIFIIFGFFTGKEHLAL